MISVPDDWDSTKLNQLLNSALPFIGESLWTGRSRRASFISKRELEEQTNMAHWAESR